MIHDVFDFERWKSEYPLSRFRAESSDDIRDSYEQYPDYYEVSMPFDQFLSLQIAENNLIVGPLDLVRIEQARALLRESIDFGRAVPTDVFVWCVGESPRREITKIGGVPYRQRHRPWPTTPTGDPMAFIGQWCFADSRDIIGETPDDVLLVFGRPNWDGIWRTEGGGLTFEWVPLGQSDLIEPAEVPQTGWKILPCYGQIHRTFDYPDVDESESWLGVELSDLGGPGLLHATKIGGAAWWEQGDPELPGRLLCILESVWNMADKPYPFLNHPEVIPWDHSHSGQRNDALMWGDVGRLYVHLNGENVLWEVQCG
jgi:hypothetical protein